MNCALQKIMHDRLCKMDSCICVFNKCEAIVYYRKYIIYQKKMFRLYHNFFMNIVRTRELGPHVSEDRWPTSRKKQYPYFKEIVIGS